MRKSSIILFALLIFTFIAYFSLSKKIQKNLSQKSANIGDKLFKDLPINKISKIDLVFPNEKINLVKEKNQWLVASADNYPADFLKIYELLKDLPELKITQTFKADIDVDKRLQLVKPSTDSEVVSSTKESNIGTLVKFFDKDNKEIYWFIIGKNQTNTGDKANNFGSFATGATQRFIKTKDTPKNVAWLINSGFEKIHDQANQWINKDFFSVEKYKSLEVAFEMNTNNDKNWKVYRENEKAKIIFDQLPEGKKLNDQDNSPIANAFSGPNFDKVSKHKEDLGAKIATFFIETFNGFNYKIIVGNKTPEDYYPITLNVTAKLPKKLTDKDNKDKLKDYNKERTRLEEKYNREKLLENWVFFVSEWSIAELLKSKDKLLVDIKPKKSENKNSINPHAEEEGKFKPSDFSHEGHDHD